MSSTMEFHLFNNLPPELRVAIWKLAILEHNRDRLLLVNDYTMRIMCTRNIACSPHFSVSSESREVALGLYPIRLSVFFLEKPHPINNAYNYVDEDASPGDEPPAQHAVYVSPQHDIFVLRGLRLAPYSELQYAAGQPPPASRPNWAWRTTRLTVPQCRSVKRVALFDFLDNRVQRADGCRRTSRCAFANSALRYKTGRDDSLFDVENFSGVQECLYVVQDHDAVDDVTLYRTLLEKPGSAVVEDLHKDRCIAWLNKEEAKPSSQDVAPGCVCNSPLPRWERRWTEFVKPTAWDPEHGIWR